ncbi:MAG: DUF2189 domain-containing protein [Actinomycetota bacterium]
MPRRPASADLSSPPFAVAAPSQARARRISAEQSAAWLARGWADLMAHPGIGLSYGAVFAVVGWLLTFGLVQLGMGSVILPLAAGFMLVAPLAAVGLYEVSRRRERGEPVTLAAALAAVRRNGEQIADFGLVLMLFFCAWFELAMLLFAAFWGGKPPELGHFLGSVVLSGQGVPFIAIGTLVGGVLAALAFALSVATMPMLLDRDVTVLDAMRTSLQAVWLNRLNMIGWAATLAALGFLGMAALFIGLAVTLPVAAHASWHAYRDLVGE